MASRTRDAIFATYGEINLPSINTNAEASEIYAWKRSANVIECYNKLFKKLNDNPDSPRSITIIAEKVFSAKTYTNVEFAFVIAICKTFLCPKYDSLQLKEKPMKSKVKYYLVGFRVL